MWIHIQVINSCHWLQSSSLAHLQSHFSKSERSCLFHMLPIAHIVPGEWDCQQSLYTEGMLREKVSFKLSTISSKLKHWYNYHLVQECTPKWSSLLSVELFHDFFIRHLLPCFCIWLASKTNTVSSECNWSTFTLTIFKWMNTAHEIRYWAKQIKL